VSARPTTRLRERLARPEILVAPGAYDALLARLIGEAGFEAVYFSGAGASYSALGEPDLGLLTMTEMAAKAAGIARAVDLPVIADGDTGYGNAINVMRTVTEYERAGVAAIQLEDQQFPKRCGHLSGKELISSEEMVGKIRAACDARSDPDFLVVARTDARSVLGLDEALRRGEQYVAAGADVLFVESPRSVAELEAVGSHFAGVPLLANMVEGGQTPLLPARDLQALGFRLVIFPNALTRRIVFAARELLATLRADGTTAGLLDRMADFTELNRALGIERYRELEARYLPRE
jgi:carboxyvinyl-carboxyphosphonate phosphorylmutase